MSAPEEILLEFSRASVGWRAPVVEHVDLQVRAGEVVGLIGPNGAGKSTLLKAVTGESNVLGGALRVGGRDVTKLSAAERARMIGVVPQQVSAAFSLPAFEFVAMGRHPHLPRFSHPGAHDREVIERAMRVTDTERIATMAVDEVSGGDLQRLAFAQALAQEPNVLLLDEPVSHLDLNHRLQVLDLTRDLARQGMAVLVVFHELDLATRYSDRISVVHDGRVRTADSPEAVITSDTLREVFGVRAVVATEPISGGVSIIPVLREQDMATRRKGRVLLVSGSGTGAEIARSFLLGGWDVCQGAINQGDTDAVLAQALGLPYAEIPAFAPMDEEARRRVRELAKDVDAIVVCEVPFGHGNVDNLRIAVESHSPLVMLGDIEGRDFTGGDAEALWRQAIDRGATVVASVAEAVRVVDGLV